ncbi:MAG: erythromycin esterase family protein, partial [Bacteroidota bacterium]
MLCLLLSAPAHAQKKNSPLWEHAHPLSLSGPDECVKNIAKFRDLFKGKRLIAMGEATHGTKEFFQMKHWFFRFLVEEMGVRFFAIEGNYSEALAVNRFVLKGEGDPIQAIGNMRFWTWNTHEVLDFVRWIRAYNLAHGPDERVQFLGFDMQLTFDALTLLQTTIEQHADARAKAFLPPLSPYVGRHPFIMKPATKDSLVSAAEAIFEWLVRDSVNLSKDLGKQQFFESKMHARLLMQAGGAAIMTGNYRDSCMTDNVRYMLNEAGPDAKMMLWAHNGHIMKRPQVGYQKKFTNMGARLSKMYGAEYFAIGFDFGGGTFAAVHDQHVGTQTITKWRGGNVRSHFMAHPSDAVFIDLHPANPTEKAAKTFSKLKGGATIGAVFYPRFQKHFIETSEPGLQYDAVIFIKETSASVP